MNSLKLSLKQSARLSQSNVEKSRLDAHALVATQLRDEHARKDIIISAKAQINKWRASRLCSDDFIKEWESLLESPIKAANVLENMDSVSIRLRQNSPFCAFLR